MMLFQRAENSCPNVEQSNARTVSNQKKTNADDGPVAEDDIRRNDSEPLPSNNHEKHRDDGAAWARQFWTPFFLRRPTMAALILVFVALLCSLIALYSKFRSDSSGGDGIGTVDSRYYYLWTYGPTAVFMLLGAFWTQVEYRACQLMPWFLMSRAPAAASNSILLDYISPWNVVSLYRSLRNRHFLVSLAVTGTLVINGLAVASTSLFELRTISMQRRTPLQLTHSFGGAQFDPHSVDAHAYMMTQATSSYDLEMPVGVVANHVFQRFQEKSSAGNTDNFTLEFDTDIRAEVDVFSLNVECEGATLNVNVTDSVWPLHMETDDCSYRNFSLFALPGVSEQPEGYLHTEVATCDGESAKLVIGGDEQRKFKPADWRLWAFLSREDPDGRKIDAEELYGRFAFSSVVCTPRYSMSRGPVTVSRRSGGGNTISSELDMEKQRPIDPLPNITAGHILDAAYRSFEITSVFQPFLLLASSPDELGPFLNVSLLSQKLQYFLESTGVQVVQDNLLQQEDREVRGTTTSIENRLFVRPIIFGLMVGLLSVLIIISAALLWFYVPLSVCCRDPSSVGGLATILARSPGLMATLHGMNLQRPDEMQKLLSEQHHTAGVVSGNGAFSIIAHNKRKEASMDEAKNAEPRWWRPISSRPYLYLFTFGIPIILIIIMEVLLHVSKTKQGLAHTEGESTDDRHQPWAYIPALVMFGVRCLFQMTEFNARIFQPFHSLSRGSASAESSVLENQHRKIAIWATLDALWKKQWALAASATTVLLAAILPIAVSGLYTIDELSGFTDLTVTQQNEFNVSAYYDLSSSVETLVQPNEMVGGMIVYLNLSYPQWTFEDLAFPAVGLSDAQPPDDETPGVKSGYIKSRLPAYRAKLNCVEVLPSEYTVEWSKQINRYYPDGSDVRITANVKNVGEECGFGGQTPNQLVPAGGGFFTSWIDSTVASPRADCPTRLYMFGESRQVNTTETIKVLKCFPTFEEVDVDVQLDVPSYGFDPAHPPSVVPGSARTLYQGSYNVTSDLRVDAVPPMVRMDTVLMSVEPRKENETVDAVTQAVLYGKYAVPAKELLSDATKLAEALDLVFGIVAAQSLDISRIPVTAASTSPDTSTFTSPAATSQTTFPATYVDGDNRLVQSTVSTRILDVLLATMVICGIASTVLMKTKNVLPKNPCSIAGVASMLVGSRMVESEEIIPVGAEWWDNKELKRKGVLAGRTFSMRWWTRRRKDTVTHSDSDESNDVIDDSAAESTEAEDMERVFGIDVDEY